MTEEHEPRRSHVISVRVSDEEMQHLTRLMKLRNTTISELMRNALGFPSLLCCGDAAEEEYSEPTPLQSAGAGPA